MWGNPSILVSHVLYTKQSGEKRFLIQDAAMNDFIRPTLYESFYRIWPVAISTGTRSAPDDVDTVRGIAHPLPRDRGALIALLGRQRNEYGRHRQDLSPSRRNPRRPLSCSCPVSPPPRNLRGFSSASSRDCQRCEGRSCRPSAPSYWELAGTAGFTGTEPIGRHSCVQNECIDL
jgi:hypothetical protein